MRTSRFSNCRAKMAGNGEVMEPLFEHRMEFAATRRVS